MSTGQWSAYLSCLRVTAQFVTRFTADRLRDDTFGPSSFKNGSTRARLDVLKSVWFSSMPFNHKSTVNKKYADFLVRTGLSPSRRATPVLSSHGCGID